MRRSYQETLTTRTQRTERTEGWKAKAEVQIDEIQGDLFDHFLSGLDVWLTLMRQKTLTAEAPRRREIQLRMIE